MFDDENFMGMSQSQQFSPQIFSTNYNQNFRSSFRRPGPQMMSQDDDDEGDFGNEDPFVRIFSNGGNPQQISFAEFINLVNQGMQEQ